jgi:hypothetical protein
VGNPDLYISTAVTLSNPPGISVLKDAPPPPAISAAEAARRLLKQADLVAAGERANLHQIWQRSSGNHCLHEVQRNARGVGILVREAGLRRKESALPPHGPVIEADLLPYGPRMDLDNADMLYLEPWWEHAYATCFLVNNRVVMTARHVFCRDSSAMDALLDGTLRVVFDYAFTQNGRPCDVFSSGTNLFSVKPVAPFSCPGAEDWIALELTSDATSVGTRQPLRVSSAPFFAETPVYSLGHPKRISQRYVFTDLPLQPETEGFRAYLDAYRGSSGSPVIAAATNEVIGMVVQSSQPGGRVQVYGEDRWVSLLCLPEFTDEATLCLHSAVFAGKY